MRNYILAILVLCLTYPILAQDEIKHTLAIGDTWESLEAQYDTCREAIIYHNDLSLKGLYSRYYILTEGTLLVILPKSACDELPVGSFVHTVVEDEKPLDIYSKYRQHPDGRPFLVLSDEPQIMFVDSTIQAGDKISIPEIEPFYKNNIDLIVTNDLDANPIEYTIQVSDTLVRLADNYQTCREAIIWENQLTLAHNESIVFVLNEGDTLLIPAAAACDRLPFGEYTLTTSESITQNTLIQRYQQYDYAYYELNETVEGLLPVGTEQILPHVEHMYTVMNDIQVIGDEKSNQPTSHVAQHGDTFDALVQQYSTCIEAILYVNDLKRTSRHDPTYKVKVGDIIEIPPASACDDIPHDPVIVTVEAGDTFWGISQEYNVSIESIYEASANSPESQIGADNESDFIDGVNKIEPGLKLVIPDGSAQYYLKYGDRLFVYDDDDIIIQPSPNISLNELAMCHGVNTWDIMEINGVDEWRYIGGSLIMPNPQHDCILRDLGHPGVVACYPQPLEQVANIVTDNPLTPIQVDEEDVYCYPKRDVYELLFQDQSVIFYDSNRPYAEENPAWDLSMSMIDYCFRQEGSVQEITWDSYDATILPPADNVHVYARPDDITCNQEMFNDYYVYQVQPYDTVTNIAKAYGTHPDLVAQTNNMNNPNALFIGQYLMIPTPTIFHIVQGLGTILAIVVSIWGLRYMIRRRQQPKAKRKPKVEA